MNRHRIEQLMKSMEQERLPQLLLCDPHTISYLTDNFIDPGERFLGLLLRHGRPLGVDKNLRAEFLLELQEQNAASCDRNGFPAAAQNLHSGVFAHKKRN